MEINTILNINDHITLKRDNINDTEHGLSITTHYKFLKYLIKSPEKYDINTDCQEVIECDLDSVKERLNTSKSLLDNFADKYRQVSFQLDEYRTMRKIISSKYKMQIVTNASLKMYELICQMQLINSNKVNVFCNAELPGGFIVAINHYLKTYYQSSVFRWLGSSYVSDNGTLGDTYHIYECNKDNWVMDENMNGDITKLDNIVEIIKRVRSKFPNGVDLYTSDAGLDVSSDYNKQEEQTLELNYCQVLIGLLVLSKNGSLVTKQFTFFTQFNKSLIYMLTYLFEELYITKPSTSRPINSEIYIVGKHFKGIDATLRDYLLSRVDSVDSQVPLILTNDDQLLDVSKSIYIDVQVKHLDIATDIIANNKEFTVDYNTIQSEWIINNPIFPINRKYWIRTTSDKLFKKM